MAQTYGDQAASTSEKFELYTISLVFTLLALSVQTGKFGDSSIADAFELLGWITLLVSGIFGLWRMELKPLVLSNLERKNGVERLLIDVEEQRRLGATEYLITATNEREPLDKIVAIKREHFAKLDEIISSQTAGLYFRYSVHKWSLLLGVTFLVLARGFQPFEQLVRTLGY